MTDGPKVLVFDIERAQGRFEKTTYQGLTVSGYFWDLWQFKRTIGPIKPDEVIEHPRTICVAWKWSGEKKHYFASEWDEGQEEMHRQIWDAWNEADILVGHNIKKFDLKHLRTGFRDLGLGRPSDAHIFDTLTQARSVFGDESKSLDALTTRMGIPSKVDKYDADVARAALAGNKAMQRKLKRYNIGDIDANDALYQEIKLWGKHPNVSLYYTDENGEWDGTDRCDCGSTEFTRQGYSFTNLGRYQRYRCKGCGKYSKGKRAVDLVDLRPVAA